MAVYINILLVLVIWVVIIVISFTHSGSSILHGKWWQFNDFLFYVGWQIMQPTLCRNSLQLINNGINHDGQPRLRFMYYTMVTVSQYHLMKAG